MKVRTFTVGALMLVGCSGPPAPDAAVCRDVIHRLCLEPRCAVVDERIAPGSDCEQALLQRTGCGDDAFEFASPSRERFLECRGTLIRSGNDPEKAPPCEDVEATFDQCEEFTRFLREGA